MSDLDPAAIMADHEPVEAPTFGRSDSHRTARTPEGTVMSKCISPRGEYGEHTYEGETLGSGFICALCFVYDEEAADAEIARLGEQVLRAGAEALRDAAQHFENGHVMDEPHSFRAANALRVLADSLNPTAPAETPENLPCGCPPDMPENQYQPGCPAYEAYQERMHRFVRNQPETPEGDR